MSRKPITWGDLFRFEGFVPDANVAFVMRALNGKVLNLKCVPMTNAVHKNGKVHAETSGRSLDMAIAWIRKRKLEKRFTIRDVRTFMREIGRSEQSAGSVIREMKAAHVAQQHGKGPAHFYYTLKGK